MKFLVLQSHDLDCLFLKAAGRFCVADFALLMRQYHQLKLFRAGAPIVADIRSVDFEVPMDSMIAAGNIPVLPPERSERRVAFIVDSNHGCEMIRAMTALRERDRQLTKVFPSFREAFEWIGRPTFGGALPPEIDRIFEEHFSVPEQEDRFSVQIRHI